MGKGKGDVGMQHQQTIKQHADEILRQPRKRCAGCGKIISQTKDLCSVCAEVNSLPASEVPFATEAE